LWPGASEFGTDRKIGFAGHQQEDRIGSAVCVQFARFKKCVDERRRKMAAVDEIASNAVQHVSIGRWEAEFVLLGVGSGRLVASGRGGFARGEMAYSQMLFEPSHRGAEVHIGQVHH
jgi:hypothetical protein